MLKHMFIDGWIYLFIYVLVICIIFINTIFEAKMCFPHCSLLVLPS